MNELCEMSKISNDARAESSSGNLPIWLCDKFNSEMKGKEIFKEKVSVNC